MALYKNFTVASLPASGLLLTTGTARQDVAIAIANAITLASGGQWAEVTGAGPTPAALQPFASTGVAAAGTTYMTDTGTMRHITLYDTLDPALLEATPRARMIRLGVGQYGITIGILDLQAAQGAVTNDVRWVVATSNNETTITSTYQQKHHQASANIDRFNMLMANMSATAGILSPQNNTTLLTDHRCYIAGDDDWMYLRIERVSDGAFAGEGLVLLFEPPVDAHWDRTNRPTIFVVRPSGSVTDGSVSYAADNNTSFAPGTTAWGAQCFTGTDHVISSSLGGVGFVADNLTPDGRLLLTTMNLISEINGTVRSSYIGRVPGCYGSYLHASVGKWNTVTIGAEVYTCMCTNGWAFWIRTT